jgi:sulfatase maturation enzyme AslB (radical SAM superfamily)
MSLTEWINSEPVRNFRTDILSDTPVDICSRCYKETLVNGSSRRHRGNQKSVIFTKQAFDESFKQSPGYQHFMFSNDNAGLTTTFLIDLHIDLGNHCNLACKMCWPGASSKIASQYVKWGMDAKSYLGVDWTKDVDVWNKFLNELLTIPKLKNIHFMGGETLLSPRFEQLIDFMIEHQRFDVNVSFVTNGTVYKPDLIEKLKCFPRVGLEISIETATEHNNYIRQGSDVNEVLDNIKKYKKLASDSNVSVTVRTAISALSIGNYYTLLEFCLEEQLLIKSLIVTTPSYLDPVNIPFRIRRDYALPYVTLLNKLPTIDTTIDYNESDQRNYLYSIKTQINQVLLLLQSQTESPTTELDQLYEWCNRWDQVYNFDMLKLYPEFKEIYDHTQR